MSGEDRKNPGGRMDMTARDAGADWILSCGGMAIRVAGGDTVRGLMARAAEHCQAWIPGFRSADRGPRRRLSALCRIVLSQRRAPRATFTARPPTLRIEGDVSLLDPETFAEMLLLLFARLLQRRDCFLIDGSAVRIHGEVVLLAGPAGAGRSAAALQLALQGHEILATDRCLVSKDMKLLDGTTAFRLEPRMTHKYPALLTGTAPPIIAPCRGKPPSIGLVVHLCLGESASASREIDRPKRKLVMSSNVISRLAGRPAVVAPWGLFLPQVTLARDVRSRHEAILNMAGLRQAVLFCRPEDLEVLLAKIF